MRNSDSLCKSAWQVDKAKIGVEWRSEKRKGQKIFVDVVVVEILPSDSATCFRPTIPEPNHITINVTEKERRDWWGPCALEELLPHHKSALLLPSWLMK